MKSNFRGDERSHRQNRASEPLITQEIKLINSYLRTTMSITALELALRKFQQNPSQENYMYMEHLMTEYQMNPPDTIKHHLEDL
jgi:hypothetical protein